MRVITGSARGRKLQELSGQDTRPTGAKVKEGLFSSIQFEIEGRKVLDLFAGTGQLGIEALSRGAERAVFVEQRRDAVNLIRENLKLTGLLDRAAVVPGEAMGYLSSTREKFDLIFIDPPYAAGLWEPALEAISRFDILSNYGIIICESPVERDIALPETLALRRTHRYGKVKLTTLCRAEEGTL